MLRALVRWLLALIGWHAIPHSATEVEAGMAQSKITVTWKDPAPTSYALKGATVQMRVKGTTAWADQGALVAPGVQTLEIDNVAPGDYELRVVETDDHGQSDASPAVVACTVLADPPGDATGVTAVAS